MALRTDDELAAWALKEAARRESPLQNIIEEVLAGSRHSNRVIEKAVKRAQGQSRIPKDALESRHGRRLSGEQSAAPPLVAQAASVITRSREDEKGLTAYRRWKGERKLSFRSAHDTYLR